MKEFALNHAGIPIQTYIPCLYLFLRVLIFLHVSIFALVFTLEFPFVFMLHPC